MPNTIATICVPALYQPTRMSRKVQDEGKTKSNPEADQEDQKSGCCPKIQSQSPMAESDQNLEGYVMYFHILVLVPYQNVPYCQV